MLAALLELRELGLLRRCRMVLVEVRGAHCGDAGDGPSHCCMALPHEIVQDDGKELAHIAEQREVRGREGATGSEREILHSQAEDARPEDNEQCPGAEVHVGTVRACCLAF